MVTCFSTFIKCGRRLFVFSIRSIIFFSTSRVGFSSRKTHLYFVVGFFVLFWSCHFPLKKKTFEIAITLLKQRPWILSTAFSIFYCFKSKTGESWWQWLNTAYFVHIDKWEPTIAPLPQHSNVKKIVCSRSLPFVLVQIIIKVLGMIPCSVLCSVTIETKAQKSALFSTRFQNCGCMIRVTLTAV